MEGGTTIYRCIETIPIIGSNLFAMQGCTGPFCSSPPPQAANEHCIPYIAPTPVYCLCRRDELLLLQVFVGNKREMRLAARHKL